MVLKLFKGEGIWDFLVQSTKGTFAFMEELVPCRENAFLFRQGCW